MTVGLGGSAKSAVLVVIRGEAPCREILLTKRALSMRHHGGEIAFPGGMREPEDASLYDTATREAWEEVALPSDAVEPLGSLPVSFTRAQTSVKPYVVCLRGEPELSDHSPEIEHYFWLPEQVLREDRRERTDIFTFKGREYWSPAYRCGGDIIWGLTARILVQVAENHFGLSVFTKREHIEYER